MEIDNRNLLFLNMLYRIVTGPPEDVPRGQWQCGGGKNIPVKVVLDLQKHQAREVKCKVERIETCQMSRQSNLNRAVQMSSTTGTIELFTEHFSFKGNPL